MIEPIKLLHAADLHLDSPFAGLPPEQAAARRQQARQLLEALPRLCRREGCRLVLLAGDLFDTGTVYRDTVDQLRQALAECPAQVFIAPGNHDPMGPDSPYQRYPWPSQVHIFATPQIETLDLGDCTVSGAAFCDGQLPSLAGFRAPQDGRPHFMVLHGDPNGPAYRTATPAEIAASGLCYLALGHIHRRAAYRTETCVTYAWPGCFMGRGFDETGPKGVYLVQAAPHAVQLHFQMLDAPRYEILDVPAAQLADLASQLPKDSARHHYRIRLTGDGPAPDLAALQAQLAPYFASLQLVDATQPPLRPADAGEDSLRGLFSKKMHSAIQAAPDAAQRQTLELALELGLQALDGREVTLP